MSLQSEFADFIRTIVREEVERVSEVQNLQLLKAPEVAKLLGFTDVHSVYQLKRSGELEGITLGDRTLRFRYSDVRDYIARHAKQNDLTGESLESQNSEPIVSIGRARRR